MLPSHNQWIITGNRKIHKDLNWPGLGPKKVKKLNILFSWNKEKEELITHLTMVIGRQFSYWSCKLGYFNLSFVVPLKASKKNLSLSWFHTYNNNLKTWNKVNHLFTPPAANNFSGLSLRGRGQGFSLATIKINVVPSYFHRNTEEKYNQKKSL